MRREDLLELHYIAHFDNIVSVLQNGYSLIPQRKVFLIGQSLLRLFKINEDQNWCRQDSLCTITSICTSAEEIRCYSSSRSVADILNSAS